MTWLDARETLPAPSRLKAEMVLLPLPSDRLKVVTGTDFHAVSAAVGAVVPTTTAYLATPDRAVGAGDGDADGARGGGVGATRSTVGAVWSSVVWACPRAETVPLLSLTQAYTVLRPSPADSTMLVGWIFQPAALAAGVAPFSETKKPAMPVVPGSVRVSETEVVSLLV